MTNANELKVEFDALVVGARCAGAATAMLLARQGMRVLAIDRHSYGSDTLSTHALMRAGVIQLNRWGLLDEIKAAGTPGVCSVMFGYGDEEVTLPIRATHDSDALFAPRRTVLDRILVDAASRAGATVVHGLTFVDVVRSRSGRVRGVVVRDAAGQAREIKADLVIGADGMKSRVAECVDAKVTHRGRHASGIVYGYWSGLPSGGYAWYYRPGMSAGAIPTNNGATCVFAAVAARSFHDRFRKDVRAGYRGVLAETSGSLAALVAQSTQEGNLRGFGGHEGFLRECAGPGWALVGDAGYFKDPISTHGISDALRDAELVASAAVIGSSRAFRRYGETRDELSLPLFQATDQIASYAWTMAEVQDLHLRLSSAMKAEVAAIRSLGAVPRQAGPGQAVSAKTRRAADTPPSYADQRLQPRPGQTVWGDLNPRALAR